MSLEYNQNQYANLINAKLLILENRAKLLFFKQFKIHIINLVDTFGCIGGVGSGFGTVGKLIFQENNGLVTCAH